MSRVHVHCALRVVHFLETDLQVRVVHCATDCTVVSLESSKKHIEMEMKAGSFFMPKEF